MIIPPFSATIRLLCRVAVRSLVAICLMLPAMDATAEDLPILTIGLLKFGTVNWEVDTIQHHAMDRRHGIRVDIRELASNEAAKVALQARAVDMIVSDWVWVARQRGEGADFVFMPYSRAVGAVMVAPKSPIAELADLRGKRIGVAGGPLDKSWLLLRALSRQSLSRDIQDEATPVFAAPPLLEAEILRGRLDAVLTYWHSAARLEALGYRQLIAVDQVIGQLGGSASVPAVGWVFRGAWAASNRRTVEKFAAASREAKDLLARSDTEWERLAPLTGQSDPAVLQALREGYRRGIPGPVGAAEIAGAEALFALLADLGGRDLVGSATRLDPATFWRDPVE
jgi:NitT/TauT family transport system substrate-binding protein